MATGDGRDGGGADGGLARLVAPAKLTLDLRVLERRPDGYHHIRARMVSVDLADELRVDPTGDGLVVRGAAGVRSLGVPTGEENLVRRALRAVGRTAGVSLLKRIPVQGGLGGGSSDAAAVLRWAGCRDLSVAAGLGGDVPFCLVGGHAQVAGIGEAVTPLEHRDRRFVLLVPPFGMDTGRVYQAWDYLQRDAGAAQGAGEEPDTGEEPAPGEEPAVNDLMAAALAVEPRLARWRDVLQEVTGRRPVLAGSGSTWYVEGSLEDLGLGGRRSLSLGGEQGMLLGVRTVPAGWSGGR